MKNISLIINAVLIVAVAVLFFLHFSGPGTSGTSNSNDSLNVEVDSVIPNKYACINIDSLLRNYEYYNELETQLLDKQKKKEAELSSKMAAFEKEAQDFQRKVQANAFLSQESAQKQEQELYAKQQNLMKWKDDVSMELAQEGQLLESQLLDTVTTFLKQFNKTEKYEIIFNSAAFLQNAEYLNITDTVVTLLNEKHRKNKEAK
ncbi:MAG: hypothetical protein CVU05_07380 [Bacteroidetes bacterium HGW-Bacteroidetes-21]|jgi:outer membrane protein|nr:MAG: hypothetical protein CVU05_07380 [Bacteroidetes bacterium HGW-Bacteroidetes-21]